MIAHLSIPAQDPRRVGAVIAKLIDGVLLPFPVVEGAVIAVARDGSGLGIEVWPDTVTQYPGVGTPVPGESTHGPSTNPWDFQLDYNSQPPRTNAVHVAVTTRFSEEEVLELGRAEGWRCIASDRGGIFKVIELWLEDRFMLEVVTEEELPRYRAGAQPDAILRMFGPPLQ
jgi:hypothetical protein